MTTPSNPEQPSILDRSPLVRCLRWFFSAKTLSRLLFGVITLVTLIALAYAVENWRGRSAWRAYEAEANARGVRVDWEAYIPTPVPDAQNFTLTPALAPLYDFLPGTQTWRDTNAMQKVNAPWTAFADGAKQMGFDPDNGKSGRWELGQRADLIAKLGEYEGPKHRTKTDAAPVTPRPGTQQEAARILLKLVNDHCGALLEELRAASQKPYSRFNIKYDHAPVAGILLPHLAMMKGCMQKLAMRAYAELALGQTNEAFEDMRLALYLSDTVKGEPLLIDQLVRIACRAITTSVIWEGMAGHQWTDAQLQRLQAGLEKDNFPAESYQNLLGERAFNVRLIDQLRTKAGGVTLANIGYSDEGGGNGGLRGENCLQAMMPSGWYYFEQVQVCRAYDSFLIPINDWLQGRIDLQTCKNKDAEWMASFERDRNLIKAILGHKMLTGMLVPAVTKAFNKSIQAQVRNDLTLSACALERYYLAQGSYPEKLEALTPQYLAKAPLDLLGNRPLKYRRESPKAYMLYSVGSNQKDDGGTPAVTKNGVPNLEEGDWVWRISDK